MGRSLLSVWAFVPLLSCIAGAGLPRIVAHCDLREASVSPQAYCQEWRGLITTPGSNTSFIGTCAGLGSTYEETECPDTDTIIGGCFVGKLGDGSGSYWWYYSSADDPMTADDVRAECESGGDTYVDWFPFDVAATDYGPPK